MGLLCFYVCLFVCCTAQQFIALVLPCIMQSLYKPEVFLQVESLKYPRNRHIKVVGLSALRFGHLFSPGNIPSTHFCYRLSRPQDHGAAGKNRTHNLPARGPVPQLSAPTGDPNVACYSTINVLATCPSHSGQQVCLYNYAQQP